MPKIKLRIIDDPGPNTTRAVMHFPPGVTPVKGDPSEGGKTDLICGNNACRFVLAEKIYSSTQLNNIVIKCPKCGQFNDSGKPEN